MTDRQRRTDDVTLDERSRLSFAFLLLAAEHLALCDPFLEFLRLELFLAIHAGSCRERSVGSDDHLLVQARDLLERVDVLGKDPLEQLLVVHEPHEVVGEGRLEVAGVQLFRQREEGLWSLE